MAGASVNGSTHFDGHDALRSHLQKSLSFCFCTAVIVLYALLKPTPAKASCSTSATATAPLAATAPAADTSATATAPLGRHSAPPAIRVNTDGRRAHRIDPLATCHFVPPCRLNRGARIGCFKYFKEKQSSYAQTRHIHSPSKQSQSQSGNETMVGSVAERWP